jgi:hypothetical protein
MENMMAKGIRSYGPGKFNTILDGFVYELALDGVDQEISLGEGQGWYGFLEFDEKTAKQITELMAAQQEPDEPTKEEQELLTFTSAVILYERSDGIVEVQWFDNPNEAEEEWGDIEKQFGEEEEEDDEEEEEEPEEDAFSDEQMAEGYVLSDAKRRSGYDVTHEHKHFGYYKYREDAFEAIDQAMKRENFYPNIYYVNDHGNVDLLDSDGKIIESRV